MNPEKVSCRTNHLKWSIIATVPVEIVGLTRWKPLNLTRGGRLTLKTRRFDWNTDVMRWPCTQQKQTKHLIQGTCSAHWSKQSIWTLDSTSRQWSASTPNHAQLQKPVASGGPSIRVIEPSCLHSLTIPKCFCDRPRTKATPELTQDS